MTSLPFFETIQEGLSNAFGNVFVLVAIIVFAALFLFYSISGNLLMATGMAVLPILIIGLGTEAMYSNGLMVTGLIVFAIIFALAFGRFTSK